MNKEDIKKDIEIDGIFFSDEYLKDLYKIIDEREAE